jgi:hypothetical protein
VADAKPKISFITTARNDDYGGNLINRINAFIKTLVHLTNVHELNSELILVEYNPPSSEKPLSEVLHIADNRHLSVRFIVVPESFHKQFETASKIPVMEYIAKNIGARRAHGEYVLCLNPDIILSDAMIKFLKNDRLDENTFYRANRHDIALNMIDENHSFEEITKQCQATTTQIWMSEGIQFVSFPAWFGRFKRKPSLRNLTMCPLFNRWRFGKEQVHEAAAGDFLLVHKNNWDKVGGYDQQPLSSFLDGYILYMFHSRLSHQPSDG